MRKLFILSAGFFAVIGLQAEQIYKQTKYPNGHIKMEGLFEDGKPVGEIKRYHENGKLQGIQVFDINGNRIGYGGGYYDTYLQKCEKRNIKIEKIGIAYSLQIVENLPTETHDIKMDYIFTEKGNIL